MEPGDLDGQYRRPRGKTAYLPGRSRCPLAVWSPKGERLIYSIFGLGSFLMETGKPWGKQTPADLPSWNRDGEIFYAWSWSPDGQKLAGFLQRADGDYPGIVLYDLASRNYEKLTDSGIEPVWFTDGRRLLFNRDGKIDLVDSQTKRTPEVLSIAPSKVAPSRLCVRFRGSDNLFQRVQCRN